jgi:hypothetical protein
MSSLEILTSRSETNADYPTRRRHAKPKSSSYLFKLPGALEPVGPVVDPAEPPDVLAPGVVGLVGPVDVPADPPELLRPKPGEVLPAAPGTPEGVPTAPPDVPPVWAKPGPKLPISKPTAVIPAITLSI